MMSARCYGNSDFDKTQFIWNFDLYLAKVWHSISWFICNNVVFCAQTGTVSPLEIWKFIAKIVRKLFSDEFNSQWQTTIQHNENVSGTKFSDNLKTTTCKTVVLH